ncbi:expressed unknown protein (Partial), partial [Seminavis robusta]
KEESVEVTNVIVEELEGLRKTTRETHHSDGTTTITTTIEEYDNANGNPSSTDARVPDPTSTTSGGLPSSDYISTSLSWDSRASLEQFETVEMDYASIVETSSSGRDNSTTKTSPRDMRNATKCCLVQQTAMSILQEMHEEDEAQKRQQQVAKQPPLVRSRIALAQSRASPSMNRSNKTTSSTNNTMEPSHSVSTSEPPLTFKADESTPSKKTILTTRGGRVYPRSTTSSDAVGLNDPDDDTIDDDFFAASKFSSKVSTACHSTSEDDGITFNTGEYAVNNDSVKVAYQGRKKKRSDP